MLGVARSLDEFGGARRACSPPRTGLRHRRAAADASRGRFVGLPQGSSRPPTACTCRRCSRPSTAPRSRTRPATPRCAPSDVHTSIHFSPLFARLDHALDEAHAARAVLDASGTGPRAGRARGPPASRGSPRTRRDRRWRTPRGSPPDGPAGCAWPSAPTPTGSRCRGAARGAGRSPARARAGSDPPAASASEPSLPCTRMRRLFSLPISICDATSRPRTPPSRRSSTAASSSSRRPGTTVARSALTCVTCRPVIVAARFSACEPMSPIAPAMPERAGSVRHSACLLPVASRRVASQPWLYCDDDLAQLAELAVRDHVARVADERVARVVVGHAEHDAAARDQVDELARLLRLVCTSGLSQTTWKPASTAAFATG